jgi:hypothetical protein
MAKVRGNIVTRQKPKKEKKMTPKRQGVKNLAVERAALESSREMTPFTRAVELSKDWKTAYEKARKVQNVPAITSSEFRRLFSNKKNDTPEEAFRRFYNYVKRRRKTK